MAPATAFAHRRSKSFVRFRRRSRCSERLPWWGSHRPRRGRARLPVSRPPGSAERLGDAGDGLSRFRENILREIAAGNRNPDFPMSLVSSCRRARRHARCTRRHGHPGPASHHRPAQGRRGARERAKMIKTNHEGKRARARQPSIGRLHPKQAAKRRRYPDRAVGVGDRARRARDRPRPGPARSARRSAGHARPGRADHSEGPS